jgi:hypothetical protein
MSATVLTGIPRFRNLLLGSALMRQELPGLQAKGFKSTGKYGIGFFRLHVGKSCTCYDTSLPRRAADTLVLEFGDGLNARPLREARADEFIRDGGTRVRLVKGTSPPREGLSF